MNITYQTKISLPIGQNPLIDAVCALSESLFTAESERLNRTIGENEGEKRSAKVKADGGYKCIHLPVDNFLSKLEEVFEKEKIEVNFNRYSTSETNKIKFLDVGCGVGQKVYLAKNLYKLDAYGLELREPFIIRANEIIDFNRDGYRVNQKRVFQGNALTYDKYNEFNIIYFYCPIADRKLQIQLEKKIAQDAKKGTILLPFLSQFFPDYGVGNYYNEEYKKNMETLTKLGWKHIGEHYFKKIK